MEPEDAISSGKHGTGQVQFNEKYSKWRLVFLKTMEKYQFVWDGHMKINPVAKHHISMNPLDFAPNQVALYQVGPCQRNLEIVEVDQMNKAGVAETATTEWASLIVIAPKMDGWLGFYGGYRRPNTDTIRDSYPIPMMDECIVHWVKPNFLNVER